MSPQKKKNLKTKRVTCNLQLRVGVGWNTKPILENGSGARNQTLRERKKGEEQELRVGEG
jgi:Arc/MetJ family transcription regulator